jgi:acetylornithine deacetylase/succinyl-diaminopimelate desuccinylase-like protein
MEIYLDDEGPGFDADADGPVYDQARAAFTDAWGVEPVDIGAGGSIPFVARFAEVFPDAAILVTGVEDPDGRAHGANESLHLDEFEHVCQAEALLLARLGAMTR